MIETTITQLQAMAIWWFFLGSVFGIFLSNIIRLEQKKKEKNQKLNYEWVKIILKNE